MGLEITQQDSTAQVVVQDEMTIYTAALQWEELHPMLAKIKALQLDLSPVSEIDSAGVQLLLALRQACQRLHNTFAITACNDEVRERLTLLHLSSLLTGADSNPTQEAVAHG